jgi:hypothetical protein
LVSPATRFEARLSRITRRPFAEIAAEPERLFAWAPLERTFARATLPVWRSRTKTSPSPLVSPGTRLVALERKATMRPSAEIDSLKLAPSPWTPPRPRLTSSVTPAASAGAVVAASSSPATAGIDAEKTRMGLVPPGK